MFQALHEAPNKFEISFIERKHLNVHTRKNNSLESTQLVATLTDLKKIDASQSVTNTELTCSPERAPTHINI